MFSYVFKEKLLWKGKWPIPKKKFRLTFFYNWSVGLGQIFGRSHGASWLLRRRWRREGRIVCVLLWSAHCFVPNWGPNGSLFIIWPTSRFTSMEKQGFLFQSQYSSECILAWICSNRGCRTGDGLCLFSSYTWCWPFLAPWIPASSNNSAKVRIHAAESRLARWY